MSNEEQVTGTDVAHDLVRDNPHLKMSKADGAHVVKSVFRLITERVASGTSVGIRGFGTFEAQLMKGRKVKSPLMKNGAISFGDQLVLRFRQSQTAKREINELAKGYAKQTAKSARAKAKESSTPEDAKAKKDKAAKDKKSKAAKAKKDKAAKADSTPEATA